MKPPFGHQQMQVVSLPVGAVVPYAGPADDERAREELRMSGWLLCDGSEVPKVEYPLLFQVLGDAYGDASGNHFRLPDYRGAFLRGVNGTRDPSLDPESASRTGSGPAGSGNSGNAVGSFQEQRSQEQKHEVQRSEPGMADSQEVRPVNLYVNFLIKAVPDRVTLTVPAAVES